jgi:hypothetical protein
MWLLKRPPAATDTVLRISVERLWVLLWRVVRADDGQREVTVRIMFGEAGAQGRAHVVVGVGSEG